MMGYSLLLFKIPYFASFISYFYLLLYKQLLSFIRIFLFLSLFILFLFCCLSLNLLNLFCRLIDFI